LQLNPQRPLLHVAVALAGGVHVREQLPHDVMELSEASHPEEDEPSQSA